MSNTKARKRRHSKKPSRRPSGTWCKDLQDIRNAFNKYIRDCEKSMSEYPTQKGSVIKYNKRRVPTLGLFLSKYLHITGATWANWKSVNFVANYAEGVKHYSEEVYERAVALHEEVNFIHDAILYRMEDALANGDGSTQGVIFNLRTNYDKNPNQIIEHIGDNKIEVEVIMTDKETINGKNTN